MELQPLTDAGRAFVELCEKHAADFAQRADEHDRDGTFPFENVDAMRASGLTAASVPAELGGLGLTSLHDMTVGIERLARGDASTAIAINMHVVTIWMMARAFLDPVVRPKAEGSLSMIFGAVVNAGLIVAVAGSEPGTLAVLNPLVKGEHVDGGYSLTGTKIFGTLSPVAGLFVVPFRYDHKDRDWHGLAWVPRDTPGMRINDDWDALGMRASGSNSIRFENCVVPSSSVVPAGPWGEWNRDVLVTAGAGNLSLVGAFLGIAESAHAYTTEMLKTRRKMPSNTPLAERATLQRAVAENEIELASARATLGRTGSILDEYFAAHPSSTVTIEDLHLVTKEVQVAKTFVQRKAVDVVDRCLQASGGSGYMGRSPLARAYRDVRAGPFMQPFSPNEAYEYIGKVALGLDPYPDL
jgi:alkylation response protein AidB-like acyl-CoA dehydrogenase